MKCSKRNKVIMYENISCNIPTDSKLTLPPIPAVINAAP